LPRVIDHPNPGEAAAPDDRFRRRREQRPMEPIA
jgi:hypothetical protein